VLAAASAFALVEAVAAGAAAGLGELFGLKKSAKAFFSGEADGLATGGATAFPLRPFFSAGEADAIDDAAAAGVAKAAFFRAPFDAGSSGAWVAVGEALATAAGAGVAAAFLRDFFAGDAAGDSLDAGEVSAAAVFLRDFLVGEADASAPAAEALASGDAAELTSAFLCDLCLAGDSAGDGDGDCPLTRLATAKLNDRRRTKYLLRISEG
jgi:hypothetical protein